MDYPSFLIIVHMICTINSQKAIFLEESDDKVDFFTWKRQLNWKKQLTELILLDISWLWVDTELLCTWAQQTHPQPQPQVVGACIGPDSQCIRGKLLRQSHIISSKHATSCSVRPLLLGSRIWSRMTNTLGLNSAEDSSLHSQPLISQYRALLFAFKGLDSSWFGFWIAQNRDWRKVTCSAAHNRNSYLICHDSVTTWKDLLLFASHFFISALTEKTCKFLSTWRFQVGLALVVSHWCQSDCQIQIINLGFRRLYLGLGSMCNCKIRV